MTHPDLLGLVRELRVGLLLIGSDRVHLANPAALQLLGVAEDEITAQAFLRADLVREDGVPLAPELHPLAVARATGEPVRNALVGVDRPGATARIWLRVDVEPRFDALGGIRELTCTLIEITDRIGVEAALQESERLLTITLDSIHEGLTIYDRELRHVGWNRRMELFFGLSANQVLGRKAVDVLPHMAEQGLDQLLQRALSGEAVALPDVEYVDPARGEKRWYSGSYGPHRHTSGQVVGVVGHIHDITSRKRMEDRLVHDALHDSLTGLANRALLMERLGRAVERVKRRPEELFAVLFLDLDRFKVVNDSLGHSAGDRLLIEIGKRLVHSVRACDTVARLGGDEFAVILDEAPDVGDAIRAATRILSAVAQPLAMGAQKIFTTASMGIAMGGGGGASPDEILRDADIAMYRAKAQGRGRYQVLDSSMRHQAAALLRLETELRHGLERQEFEVFYQPILSLATGGIDGFEALVRWRHPQKGMVPPDVFVPLAEDTGLIVPLGRWVLREASRQLQAWRRSSPQRAALALNVNVSGCEFSQEGFADVIEEALRETGLDPAALRLEITESSIVEDTATASETIRALKRLGVQLHVDDFGMGYSSLSSLHRFPIDGLKIDRSFVGRMVETGEGREIVRTVILLAQNLAMDVVAEGVETRGQLEELRALGCKHAQGFLFAPPLTRERAESFLASGRAWSPEHPPARPPT